MIAEAKIRFKGRAFHSSEWHELLRVTGFRVVSSGLDKIIYTSGGSYLVAKQIGFVRYEEEEAFDCVVELRQSKVWEGFIKFYATLLAAFAVPQEVVITLDENDFTEQSLLKQYAEKKILQLFPEEDLIDNRVYREGDGVQFL
ncbi:hypothetical protein [Gimesia maris]|uniref:Uncharacterized protein n=1 Tax=Gimesia maris TaxID=122 RepID=A0ABX5YHF2_9PLAN|nr:hypothetical protein [Gimesia maris]EDL61555.1 hypothetical protein PM8797T_04620 [Gimesia maris DSM 8797]QEG15046.1 hypothetical protein GmarT_08840 [Gimesia maris]QGQ31594.1 hypothetical protein F1729_24795 [Gimesia maris]